MDKNLHDTIPAGYPACIQHACPMAERCLHQMAYERREEMELYMRLLNPARCTASQSCPHYADSRPMRFAKGFTGFQKKMYPQQYDRFMTTLCLHFGRNQYYKRRRGEILLTSEEQEIIREQLRRVGADDSMEFDCYVDKVNWLL